MKTPAQPEWHADGHKLHAVIDINRGHVAAIAAIHCPFPPSACPVPHPDDDPAPCALAALVAEAEDEYGITDLWTPTPGEANTRATQAEVVIEWAVTRLTYVVGSGETIDYQIGIRRAAQ